jgi:chlorophyllase-like protein
MTRISIIVATTTLFGLATGCIAQPLRVDMMAAGLPLEGAPLADRGPYQVAASTAFGSPGLTVAYPTNLDVFPSRDVLPALVWANGGCAVDSTYYADFFSTIASHGFLVIATAKADANRESATVDDLRAALDWIETENKRADSPLNGKIATDQIAVMGQSCGAYLSIGLGADPRVDTVGVFNGGVRPDRPGNPAPPPFLTVSALANLHGPVLIVNGHEADYRMEDSKATFDAIDTLPAFYGARHDAGHMGTILHPGGGELANVASNWLMWWFKGNRQAGAMFAGRRCDLCKNSNWDVATKAWPSRRRLRVLR